jgi:hypothetical protein
VLDPDKPTRITIVGASESGKSVLARYFWDSWPYDRIVVDPTGDADPGPDTKPVEAPLPTTFPASVDDEHRRVSLSFIADPGSPTYADDMDRAVGMALRHPAKRCLLWVDEVTELTTANRTPPNMRRLLGQSRHHGTSWMLCGPRPIDVDPLVLSQATWVYVFDLPNPRDRRRVADTIGFDPGVFDAAVLDLGPHEYLRWDKRAKDLAHYPALPPDRRRPETAA